MQAKCDKMYGDEEKAFCLIHIYVPLFQSTLNDIVLHYLIPNTIIAQDLDSMTTNNLSCLVTKFARVTP